jgi:hypothetical protein
MATRAANLDPRHVEALNTIDVVFHGRDPQETAIRSLWKQYLDHLNNRAHANWADRRIEILVDLLHAMATHLGLDFDKTHIKNQCYYPTGWGTMFEEQAAIRRALAAILTDKAALPVQIVNPPDWGAYRQ